MKYNKIIVRSRITIEFKIQLRRNLIIYVSYVSDFDESHCLLSCQRNLRRARRGGNALSIRAGYKDSRTNKSLRGCEIAETTKSGSTDGGYICISGGCPAPTATYSLGNPSRNASRLFRRRGVGMRLRSKIIEKVF